MHDSRMSSSRGSRVSCPMLNPDPKSKLSKFWGTLWFFPLIIVHITMINLLELVQLSICYIVAHATWHHSSPHTHEQQLLLSSLKPFYQKAHHHCNPPAGLPSSNTLCLSCHHWCTPANYSPIAKAFSIDLHGLALIMYLCHRKPAPGYKSKPTSARCVSITSAPASTTAPPLQSSLHHHLLPWSWLRWGGAAVLLFPVLPCSSITWAPATTTTPLQASTSLLIVSPGGPIPSRLEFDLEFPCPVNYSLSWRSHAQSTKVCLDFPHASQRRDCRLLTHKSVEPLSRAPLTCSSAPLTYSRAPLTYSRVLLSCTTLVHHSRTLMHHSHTLMHYSRAPLHYS